MASSLVDLFNIYPTPTEVFVRVRERPLWFLPFLFITAVSIGVAWFTWPITKALLTAALSRQLPPEQLASSMALSDRFAAVGFAAVPVFLLVRWLLLATLIFSLAVLLGSEQVRFKPVFAVVVYSEAILLLMSVVNILLVYVRGVEHVHQTTDLQAIIGLDFFLEHRSANLALFALLNNVNVFNLWYVGVLGIGIAQVTGFGRWKSGTLAATVWLLGVAFQAALIAVPQSS